MIALESRFCLWTAGENFADADPIAAIFDTVDGVDVFDSRYVADFRRGAGFLASHGAHLRMHDASLRRGPVGGAVELLHPADDGAGDRGRNGYGEKRHEYPARYDEGQDADCHDTERTEGSRSWHATYFGVGWPVAPTDPEQRKADQREHRGAVCKRRLDCIGRRTGRGMTVPAHADTESIGTLGIEGGNYGPRQLLGRSDGHGARRPCHLDVTERMKARLEIEGWLVRLCRSHSSEGALEAQVVEFVLRREAD